MFCLLTFMSVIDRSLIVNLALWGSGYVIISINIFELYSGTELNCLKLISPFCSCSIFQVRSRFNFSHYQGKSFLCPLTYVQDTGGFSLVGEKIHYPWLCQYWALFSPMSAHLPVLKFLFTFSVIEIIQNTQSGSIPLCCISYEYGSLSSSRLLASYVGSSSAWITKTPF